MSNFSKELDFEVLSEENIKEVHQFCENNVDRWSQPLYFFRLASLEDTAFESELTIVARNKSHEIIGFFFGTTRKSMFSGLHQNILKFFVIKREERRKGLASTILSELYQRFLKLGYKGKIEALCSPPDYWFPGMNPKFTAALFFLRKHGFKTSMLPWKGYRQNLYVDFENPNILIDFKSPPPDSKEIFKFIRVSPKYYEKTIEFVKKEFHGVWHQEVKLSFRNDPPTTYICVDSTKDEVVGFATYNAHFSGSFGPTGVLKSIRGKGIGGILLKWTLYDLYKNGHKGCQIMWVVGDTVKYYSKVAGAYILQIFFPMSGKIRNK